MAHRGGVAACGDLIYGFHVHKGLQPGFVPGRFIIVPDCRDFRKFIRIYYSKYTNFFVD